MKVKAEVRVIQAKEPKDGQHPPEAGARPARGAPLGPSELALPCNSLILTLKTVPREEICVV